MATTYSLTLEDKTTILIDATTQITEVFSGTATNNPVANQTSTSDHFIVNNARFSFSGIISGVFNPPNKSTLRDSSQITKQLRDTIKKSQLVIFKSGDRSYKNCFVENLTLIKTAKEGLDGWKITARLKQVIIATGGEVTVVAVKPDPPAPKTDLGTSSTKGGVDNTLNIGVFSNIGKVFTGNF